MSDQFENDFETAEEEATSEMLAAAESTLSDVASEPVTVEIADGDEVNEDDAFFATNAAPEAEAAQATMDPATTVTLIPSAGDNKYVQAEDPTPMIELIAKSGLQFAGDFQCYLNGAEVGLTSLIPGGSTVIIAGKVKGG